jgi:hypothetical protein
MRDAWIRPHLALINNSIFNYLVNICNVFMIVETKAFDVLRIDALGGAVF